MDYIEQTGDWTEQERLEWVRTYKNIIDSKKKCCYNCDYFAESAMDFAEGFCMKKVANTLCGQYLENTYTFYCSYHKLRLNNE